MYEYFQTKHSHRQAVTSGYDDDFDYSLLGPARKQLNSLILERNIILEPSTMARLQLEATTLYTNERTAKMRQKIYDGVKRYAFRHIVMDSLKLIFKDSDIEIAGSHDTAVYYKRALDLSVQRHRFNFYQIPPGRIWESGEYPVPLPHGSQRLKDHPHIRGVFYFGVTEKSREMANFFGDLKLLNFESHRRNRLKIIDATMFTPNIMNQEYQQMIAGDLPIFRTTVTPETLNNYADEIVGALK